jgi:hypothetical protein
MTTATFAPPNPALVAGAGQVLGNPFGIQPGIPPIAAHYQPYQAALAQQQAPYGFGGDPFGMGLAPFQGAHPQTQIQQAQIQQALVQQAIAQAQAQQHVQQLVAQAQIQQALAQQAMLRQLQPVTSPYAFPGAWYQQNTWN